MPRGLPDKKDSRKKKVKSLTKYSRPGQPTAYRPEYCQQMIDFFSREFTREEKEILTFKDGTTKETYKIVPNELPQFGKFALSIGVDQDTIVNWSKKHEEFFGAYQKCKQLQKEFIINNGILGLYSAPFAIFTAKNITDMRDGPDNQVNIQINLSSILDNLKNE